MTIPEPTPQEKALKRVLTISRLNGWSVAVIAAIGILLTLAFGDWVGVFIGLLAGVAGWMEIHGHNALKRRDPAGTSWLVRSQLFLLGVILAYCASRLGSFDEETMLASLTPEMEAVLKEAGIERPDIMPLVRVTYLIMYGTVAFVSIAYQGGLGFYYRRKAPLVAEALATPPAS